MNFEYSGPDPTDEQIEKNLLSAQAVCERAVQEGKHPFGAILVAPDHQTVLLEQGNIDTVNHAEATLARVAADKYDADYLWNCTLYTTLEPCVMCTGTCYWANIGRIVFGATEKDLLKATGDHDENPTMDLPCRDVVSHGQKPIRVWGPIPALQNELMAIHQDFWKKHA